MNILQIFFAEWWPTFLGLGVVFVGFWFAERFASDSYFLFTTPKSFKELAGNSPELQYR
jgi:hypothetical protein